MRFLILLILLFNMIIAQYIQPLSNVDNVDDVDNNVTIISLPQINEENLTNNEIQNGDENKIKIAVVIDKEKFFKYLPSLINSIDAYLLNKDTSFEVKVFNMDKNLSNLDEITQNYNNIFIYETNPEIVNELNNYPDNSFFLPIINKNQVDLNSSSNIFFGGLNFDTQIKKLSSFVEDESYIIKESSMLSDLTTDIEKNIIYPEKILIYPINYKAEIKDLNNSYVFLNTNVVNTAQILSNFTYYEIKPKLILSTQINYNPLLFSLTTPEDYKSLIIASSLLLPDIRLLDVNMNLGSNLKFNWLNYTTSALLNKMYVDETDEYPYFLNDFNLYIFHNQVDYKTKLYKIFDNGFIEVQ